MSINDLLFIIIYFFVTKKIDIVNMKLKPPLVGGKSLSESFIQPTNMIKWLIHSEKKQVTKFRFRHNSSCVALWM